MLFVAEFQPTTHELFKLYDAVVFDVPALANMVVARKLELPALEPRSALHRIQGEAAPQGGGAHPYAEPPSNDQPETMAPARLPAPPDAAVQLVGATVYVPPPTGSRACWPVQAAPPHARPAATRQPGVQDAEHGAAGAHESADTAPVAAVYLPAAHAVQSDVPVVRLLYEPAAHAGHADASVRALYLPAAHAVQAAEVVAPARPPNMPNGHAVGRGATGGVMSPPAQ